MLCFSLLALVLSYQTTTYMRYPYASLRCDCDSHLALGMATGRRGPNDANFQPFLAQATRRSRVQLLLTDAGYDSEAAHVFARQHCGMRTLIPATRRPTDRQTAARLLAKPDARAIQSPEVRPALAVETVNSMVKRSMDSSLRARHYHSQSREIVLRIITHNLVIIWRDKVFYRANFGTSRPRPVQFDQS